jgi:glycosyltransferase involved in cell wall biosynthesis
MISKVSVIIPTYNRADLLPQAIDSVLDQAFSGAEVIVVDDGSTDGTARILQARYGDRICYSYQANCGRSAARNRGIAISSAPYLLFLDSDDLLLPGGLQQQVAYLDAHPGVDLLYTDGYFCNEAGRELGLISAARPPHLAADILEDLVISNVIVACHSAMVRRLALDAVGPPYFDEALRGTEDEDLWIRLAAGGRTFAYLDGPTCIYRLHGGNASRFDPSSPAFWKRQESVARSRFKILESDFFPRLSPGVRERFFDALARSHFCYNPPALDRALASPHFQDLPPAARARIFFYLGKRALLDDDAVTPGRQYLRKAARLAPWIVKYRLILWLSYLGMPLFRTVLSGRRRLKPGAGSGAASSPIGVGGLQTEPPSPGAS